MDEFYIESASADGVNAMVKLLDMKNKIDNDKSRYYDESPQDKTVKKYSEEELREHNAPLQDAWDRYQTMLKLVAPAPDPNQSMTPADILERVKARLNAENSPASDTLPSGSAFKNTVRKDR